MCLKTSEKNIVESIKLASLLKADSKIAVVVDLKAQVFKL